MEGRATRIRAALLVGALIVGGSVGCEQPAPTDPRAPEGSPAAPVQRLRGELVLGHEVRSFTPCASGSELWVIDRTGSDLGDTYRALAAEPYQKLYVELRAREVPPLRDGFGADYAGTLEVVELRRAALETAGCAEDQVGLELAARGNEPFWRLEIRADGIRLAELGAPAERVFPRPEPRTEGTARSYAARADGSGEAIEILLTEQRCVDSMSGERFPYTAQLRVDGRVLAGCALEGDSSPSP